MVTRIIVLAATLACLSFVAGCNEGGGPNNPEVSNEDLQKVNDAGLSEADKKALADSRASALSNAPKKGNR